MKRTSYVRRLTIFLVALSIVLASGFGNMKPASAAESQSPSLAYAQAMGKGWNIFNTFDSINSNSR
jgi:endoglucanase